MSRWLAGNGVDRDASLDAFLASVERRGFAMARSATGDRDDALDILQETMAELVLRYRDRDPEWWRPLFYRILNSKIHDVHRRRARQRRLFVAWWHSDAGGERARDGVDRIAGPEAEDPARQTEDMKSLTALHTAIAGLPRRQREAFLLRCWEGLSTADTARSMQCSEGSVKTHYARALAVLRDQLKDFSP